MGKIKIGLIILGLMALVGLVMAGAVMANSQLRKGNSDNSEAKYVPDEIIVKFKGDQEPFRVIKVSEGKVKEKINEFKKRADVIYAEPNYIASALMVPNDPYYQYQWHLDSSVYGGIQMEEAWGISTGQGVTVAVVDTGIRKGTDLANTCFVSGWDYVNSDSDPTDDNGHGTHVAGTIAQSTNNGLGVAGVAFNSCLMPIKVLDATGDGTYTNVASGIRYAADNGSKVINLSLGGTATSTALEEALAYAYGKGATIIAAAGNDALPFLSYPAAYDDYVIAVGATQYDETKAPYSNYGPSLDLVAPGGNNNLDQNKDGYADGILQQTFSKTGVKITWGYYFFQGTSMAAAHVSGAAALLIAKGNATTSDQIRTALQETADDLGIAGRDDTYGYGLIDAYKALNWVPDTTPPLIKEASATLGSPPQKLLLTNGTIFSLSSDTLGWISEDPNYLPEPGPWYTQTLGVAKTFFSYKKSTESSWSPEIELPYSEDTDSATGKYGRWSWVHPVQVLLPDGVYDIKLIAQDKAGNKGEATYQIQIYK